MSQTMNLVVYLARAERLSIGRTQRELLEGRQPGEVRQPEQLEKAHAGAVEDRRAGRVGAAQLLHEAALLERR